VRLLAETWPVSGEAGSVVLEESYLTACGNRTYIPLAKVIQSMRLE